MKYNQCQLFCEKAIGDRRVVDGTLEDMVDKVKT